MGRFVQLPVVIGRNLIKPIFHLDFNSEIINDISGNGYAVTNKGVSIAEHDGRRVGDFSSGYLILNRNVFANLWDTGVFTIDFQLRMNVVAASYVLFGSCRATDKNAPGVIWTITDGLYYVRDTDWDNATKFFTFIANTWYHVRISADNFNFKCIIDGEELLTGTIAGSLAQWQLLLGGQTHRNGGNAIVQNGFPGYIDDFKIYNVAL